MMKHIFYLGFVCVGLVGIVGCGGNSGAYSPLPNAVSGQGVSDCGYAFAGQGLCARIEWKKGPTIDGESELVLKFWPAGSDPQTSAAVIPRGEVTSFLRMTCCGSISANRVTPLADGQYSVDQLRFLSGDWELYIQIKNGPNVEKQFLPVHLD